MFRIDSATAAGSLPALGAAGTPGFFTVGNPATGTPATVVTGDWLNIIQEEVLYVVTQGGQTPAKSNTQQLYAAIQALITAATGALPLPQTGDVKLTVATTAPSGWVLMNDGSIGDASSGGTTRANADTSALFTLLWNNIGNTNCPTQDSTGTPVGRGASAAADFAAHRRIVLPKALGRALAVAGTGSGLTARALGDTVGEETHLLTVGEIPSHNHAVTSSGSNVTAQSGSGVAGGNIVGGSSGSTGGGGTHNNMQPTAFLNVLIKL